MATEDVDGPVATSNIGPNDCEIRFLMVNGEAFHDTFPCSALVSDVKQAVVNKKPKELVEFLSSSLPPAQPPTKVDDLRILHLGKFLEDGKSLEEYKFAKGVVTTVHISCKVQSAAVDDVKGKVDKKSGTCCVVM